MRLRQGALSNLFNLSREVNYHLYTFGLIDKWCIVYAYKGGVVGWGGVYCTVVVELYCNRVGVAGGGGQWTG